MTTGDVINAQRFIAILTAHVAGGTGVGRHRAGADAMRVVVHERCSRERADGGAAAVAGCVWA